MQIPIVSGIFADSSPDFRTSYPRNMIPIPKQQGISQGYLRPSDGIVQNGTGPGYTRGGIEWEGVLYRVMGDQLVSIDADGNVTSLGNVGFGSLEPAPMAYSFDRLAIASGGKLFYWDGLSLTQVTDPDLGTVLDVLWIDGYFMTTDGANLVVTELNDPAAVDPLKYGSSEVDPDPINGIVRIRNEIYAVNRYTIEVFANVGGTGFPFQRIDGAQIMRGAIGTYAKAEFREAVAFVGGGKQESIGVFVGGGGSSSKISTREIDEILNDYTTSELEAIYVEVRRDRSNDILMVHTPRVTLCFDAGATEALGQPVWYKLTSGVVENKYLARHHVWAYNKWCVGSPSDSRIGYLDGSLQTQWGDIVTWEFGTPVVYNNARGAIIHSLELVGLTGAGTLSNAAKISAEYSTDGNVWSQPKYVTAGPRGDRYQRLRWLRQGSFRQRRMYRFRGDSNGPIAVAALEAEVEPLAW